MHLNEFLLFQPPKESDKTIEINLVYFVTYEGKTHIFQHMTKNTIYWISENQAQRNQDKIIISLRYKNNSNHFF